MKAPIVIFGYNRPDLLAKMFESLMLNHGIGYHDIYVFIDGPKNEDDRKAINESIGIAKKFTDKVYPSNSNKGLAASVIQGVSQVIDEFGAVIVIEDDLILMPGFLDYMDKALSEYEKDSRIFSICGYGLKIDKTAKTSGDLYLSLRSSSWGWGTWKDRWETVDWNVEDFEELCLSPKAKKNFNKGGSDMFSMLKGYMEGKNNSWAIRFCYAQHKTGGYSIHPFKTLVLNEGFDTRGTNCRQKYSRFKTEVDKSGTSLVLPSELEPDEEIFRQLAKYHGIPLRLYSYARRILNI